jgi:hypothetical protein
LNYDPDAVGQRSIYGDYARLDAIQIVIEAEEICKEEFGRKHGNDYLLSWLIPTANGSFPYFTEAEKARINWCLKELEKRLLFMGFIDYATVAREE